MDDLALSDWMGVLLACRRRSERAVLVTVASVLGSVPREPGTRMVVTALDQHGTIGGGHLELEAVAVARGLLADGGAGTWRRFPLGASLGQCCGGLVNLMFEAVWPPTQTLFAPVQWLEEVDRCRSRGEPCVLVGEAGCTGTSGSMVVTTQRRTGSLGNEGCDAAALAIAREMLGSGEGPRMASLSSGGPPFLFDPLRPPELDIVLFGAGHVGQALVKILADLPCRVAWIDERADWFPPRIGGNIRAEVTDAPLAEVDAARRGACFLVMTHSHSLDEALAEGILRRGDFRYFGLIGSPAKRSRFERRLAARGISPQALARMTCPIGIEGIDGKEPAVIAVAVAAELMRAQRSGDSGARTA